MGILQFGQGLQDYIGDLRFWVCIPMISNPSHSMGQYMRPVSHSLNV